MNTQHAFFLNAGQHALSATLFQPLANVRGAVLFIPPFMEERKGALPAFVQTARALAEKGIASLLFDFSGCGDSEGDFADQQPPVFEADCNAAWEWLANAFPNIPRAVLGLRCGALLAAGVAHASACAACVQWAPVAGADFLRQLLQRRMVNDMVAYGKARESRADIEARWTRGEAVDLDGYSVNAALAAWLQTLTPATQSAAQTLTLTGNKEPLRFPPFWNTVGHVDLSALITATTDWLATTLDGHNSQPPIPDTTQTALAAQPVSFGQDGQIRAMLDLPSGTPRAGALFLHGWSGDRTGPHRLFTSFARQLAQRGFLCLRPDFIGRGLSDGAASDASIAGMAQTAQTALDDLRGHLPPNAPIIVIAICSGCKVAVTLAAANPGIAQLVLWSAESMGDLRSSATGARKALNALRTYARKLCRPETWKKLLKGKVQGGMVMKALVKQETRSAEEAAWENGVLQRFRAFRNPLLFVFGGSDPDTPGSSRAYTQYCSRNKIPCQMHTIDHAGHSYYGEAWTNELFDISLRFLNEAL